MAKKQPITPDDLYQLRFVEDPQISPDGTRVAFVKVSVDKLGNRYQRAIWLAAADGKTPPRRFTYGAKADTSPRWSPDGQTLAFVSAREGKPQIYLIALAGGEARPLTSMPEGASNPVWSPDGRRLAFLARVNADERKQEDAGAEDPPPADALEARHRGERRDHDEKLRSDPRVITRLPYRTGTDYLDDRRSHIYVIDVGGDEPATPRRITDGERDYNVIAWAADGAAIISSQSREPDYDPWFYTSVVRLPVAARRRAGKLLSRPGHEYFDPKVSPNGKWIAAVRVGDRGSFGEVGRLAILPAAGGAARELTGDFDRAVEAVAWSSDSRWLYFQAGDRGDVGLYRVAARGGPVQKVVGGRRMLLGFSLAKTGRIAFVAHSPVSPTDLYAAEPDGKREKQLTRFNAALLAERLVAPIEAVRHTSPDGRRIQGWLLRPAGPRPGRKAPLIVSMHGGPWVMWGPGMPGMWLEWQCQAARGYGVYFCNPRGSQGYGEEHATVIRNDWGDHVMRDVLSGLDHVVKKGGVDTKRLALTGGSYAGYLTAWIVSRDHRFACAWAQRGLYNLTSFFGTSDIPQLIEREFEAMGFDDIERLWQHSPLAHVRGIRTPLAIEHQDNDWRCPPSEAEQLYAALKRLKRKVVMIRYPREGHEMSRAGEPHHRVDRLNRMLAWFDQHCRPAPPRRKTRRTGR